MTAPMSPPTMVDPNERELLAMARMLRRGSGTFVLAFARLPVPARRVQLVAALREALAPCAVPLNEVTLSGRDADIHAELAAAPGPGQPLLVYGLEQVMPASDPYRALGQLNERRGHYAQLARPVVFWVPEYVLRLVATHAPDFWAWRSGVYVFGAARDPLAETSGPETARPWHTITPHAQDETAAHIQVLRALVDDYQGDDVTIRFARAHALHNLARLHAEQKDFVEALQLLTTSRDLFYQLGLEQDARTVDEELACVRSHTTFRP